MKPVLNKPRVFLSHSAKDKKFIDRLFKDLRKCQIEPWLDTEEIRDGKSWLKVIFEDGIPTCDAVIVYFTENSISSPMVAKEIDAALIQNLSEYGIAFLPYVEKTDLRSKLRIDLRSLQCREWNTKNYNSILSSVVSEVWRCHMEKSVESILLKEKNRVLELELELTKLKQSRRSVFDDSEHKEFSFLYDRLKREEIFDAYLYEKESIVPTLIRTDTYNIMLIDLLIYYVKSGRYYFDLPDFNWELADLLKASEWTKKNVVGKQYYTGTKIAPDLSVELKTYGLIRGVNKARSDGRNEHVEEITEKFYRFIYWCDFNAITENSVNFKYVGVRPSD